MSRPSRPGMETWRSSGFQTYTNWCSPVASRCYWRPAGGGVGGNGDGETSGQLERREDSDQHYRYRSIDDSLQQRLRQGGHEPDEAPQVV